MTLSELRATDRVVISFSEAAGVLGVAPSTLNAMHHRGELPAGLVLHMGRRFRVSVPALLRWLGAEADGAQGSSNGPSDTTRPSPDGQAIQLIVTPRSPQELVQVASAIQSVFDSPQPQRAEQ